MDLARFFAFLVRRVCGPGVPLIISCLILFGFLLPAHSRELPAVRAAVLVSRNIMPYLEAVEGFKAALLKRSDGEVDVFGIEKLGVEERADLSQSLAAGEFDLLVGVGPEAGLLVWKGAWKKGLTRLYLMVLNPDKVFGPGEKACGIPLNIPAQLQVEMIRRGLPSIRRPGLLFDPQLNSDFFSKTSAAGALSGLTIVPLKISSKKDIPSVLKRQWEEIDSLWLIPDRTVISESIVRFVVKEALIKGIPVIGYNRFFYETGVALAFVLDYGELGMQCAEEALKVLAGETCRNISPLFHVWVNPLVARKLGLKLPEKYTLPIELGP